MPLMECSIDGESGWKWGSSGKCYVGDDAKEKAAKQGVAIGDYVDSLTTETRPTYVQQMEPNGQVGSDGLFRPLSSESRTRLPDNAFAYVKPGGELVGGKTNPLSLRMFPHHDLGVGDPTENSSVDRELLRNSIGRLPQANLSVSVKRKIYKHLSDHAMSMDPPIVVSEPSFKDGPQPLALMFRDDGSSEWVDDASPVKMSLQISDVDKKSLHEAMESEDQELGRPASWVQVVGCGKRFINGNWVEISPSGDCDHEEGRLSLEELSSSFKKDIDRGVFFFVDYGHSHSNRQADFVSEMSAGDILDLQVRQDGLWAKVLWTPRAARSIIDGEFNLTSIHFRWFGVDNLSDPPESRGPHFVNFALTNNPAWQGQAPVNVQATNQQPDSSMGGGDLLDELYGLLSSWTERDPSTTAGAYYDDLKRVVDGYGGEYVTGGPVKKKPPMWADENAESIDLSGGTVQTFMEDIQKAVMKAGMGGMFGDVVPGEVPSFVLEQVTGDSVVVENESGVYVIAGWGRDDDGNIVLTNPHKAKKTYVAARVEPRSGEESEMKNENEAKQESILDPVEDQESSVKLREDLDATVAERDALLETIEKLKASDSNETALLRKQNEEFSERLAAMELETRDAKREAARGKAKVAGVPERMMARVLDAYDGGGDEAMKAYIDDLDEIGALTPVGKRTGSGAGEADAGESGNGDKRGEAWRTIDKIRSDAAEKNEQITSREAMVILREENPDLYDSLGVFSRPVNGHRS